MTAGILNDKGMNDSGVMFAKIGEHLMPVMPYVIPFLEKIEKGSNVEYNEKDGKITKIARVKASQPNARTKAEIDKEREDYNAKAAKAGFVLPGKQDTCTSPDKPAAEPSLKSVEGQITALDVPAHKITVKTRDGTHHEMIWPGSLDDKMAKLQQWWFTKITAEKTGEYWKVTAQDFFQRPADWPFAKGSAGGKSYQPRNERLIVLQSSLKVCADMFTACTTPDTQDYDQAIDMIVEKAIQITEKLMIAGGA